MMIVLGSVHPSRVAGWSPLFTIHDKSTRDTVDSVVGYI